MSKRLIIPLALLALLLFLPAAAFALAPGEGMNPAQGPCTSDFGWRTHPVFGTQKFHSGVDIGVDYGAPIVATGSGTVTYAGWIEGYGNTVIIDHGGGVESRYAHMQAIYVGLGPVTAGTQVGEAGSTGYSTGPHLHFEIRVGGEPVHPGSYVPELYTGAVNGSLGLGRSPEGRYKEWTLTNDFAKPIKEIMDSLAELITKGLNLLQEYVAGLFFVLCCIDIAIGAMGKVISPVSEDKEGLAPWMIRRCFFYGFCLVFLYNWKDFIGNLSLHGFPVLGGLLYGDQAAAQAAVSDPTQIVQKGMSIIAPIINASLRSSGSVIDFLLGEKIALLCLLLAAILFFLFCVIGFYIAIAYIQFYASVLFSFTAFPLAGLKHVRHFASNGVNGVLACSINLMFFCFFAASLQATLADFTVPSLVTTTTVSTPAGSPRKPASGTGAGAGGASASAGVVDISGRPHADIAIAISERTGIRADFIYAQMALESSHFESAVAIADHNYAGVKWYGAGKKGSAADDGEFYRHFDTDEEFIEYQSGNLLAYAEDGITEAQTPAEFAAALKRGGYYAAPESEYAAAIGGILDMNPGSVMGRAQSVVNLFLLLQVLLITLLYMFMADRISKLIIQQFGGQGLQLYREQGVFSR